MDYSVKQHKEAYTIFCTTIMNKQELLSAITEFSRTQRITQEEIVRAYADGDAQDASVLGPEMSHLEWSSIMYYLGGGIIAIGIAIFLSEHWDSLSVFTRILSTLGSGIAAFAIGVVLMQDTRYGKIGEAFHTIAAVVLPIGLVVSLDEYGVDTSDWLVLSCVYGVCALLYATSYAMLKRNIFALGTIVFASIFFVSIVNAIGSEATLLSESDFNAYQFLTLGLSYIALGYSFVQTSRASITRYLYGVGLLFFFISTLVLGGYFPEQNYFWELVFPLCALGGIFVSVPLRSKIFLILSTVFLVGYIFKITGEYFTDSIGWPLALVAAGCAMIGVGFLFVKVNRQYTIEDKEKKEL